MLKDFCLAPVDKYEGASRIADVERFVILVENKNR
jgi:hypothetical protein